MVNLYSAGFREEFGTTELGIEAFSFVANYYVKKW